MNDLISRQAAIDAIDDIESEVSDGYGFQYEKWRKHFCEMPSVDAVEVIRCRDCKWLYEADIRGKRRMVCDFMDCMMGDMDFCSKAERKE